MLRKISSLLSLALAIALAPAPAPVFPEFHAQFLAPQTLLAAKEVQLTDIERQIQKRLAQKRIWVHPDAPPAAIRKLYEALNFCSFAQNWKLKPEQFREAILKLDAQYGKEFLRCYPVTVEETPCVGINLLVKDGSVARLVAKPMPVEKEPAAEVVIGPPTESELAEQKRSVLIHKSNDRPEKARLSLLESDATEKEWIGKLENLDEVKAHLPVPLHLIELNRKKIERFFLGDPEKGIPGVPENVKTLLLEKKNTSFRQFLKLYPEAVGVFHDSFNGFDPDKPIPLVTNPDDKKGYVVHLINRLLQAIFVKQFGSSVDQVVDFSHYNGSNGAEGPKNGPSAVNDFLSAFLDALEQASRETGLPPQEIPFKKSPILAFGEWLENGAAGPLVFEAQQDPSQEAIRLNEGALLFDIDMTLLTKSDRFDGDEKPPIFHTLIRLLEYGAPVRLITGNAAQTQYLKILRPLEEYLGRKKPILQNIELFAATGSVRIYYDPAAETFVRDTNYDPRKLLDQPADPAAEMKPMRQDLDELVKQLNEDLGRLMGHLFRDGKNNLANPDQTAAIRAERDGWFQIQKLDFKGSPTPNPDVPFFMQDRDGMALCLSGWGFLTQDRNGKNGETRRPVLLSEEGFHSLKEIFPEELVHKYHYRFAGDPSLKGLTLFLIKYFIHHGTDEQKRIYRKFYFASGGDSSTDVTIKWLTKATAARFIFSETKDDGAPRFRPDASVYFGDEFTFPNGSPGNDVPLSEDPVLDRVKKAHVGRDSLEKSAFDIVVRDVMRPSGVHKRKPRKEGLGEMYFILDSLDGAREILESLQDRASKPPHSYSATLFYRHFPILCTTLFVNAEADKPALLTSDLLSAPIEKRHADGTLNLQASYRYDRNFERLFMDGLEEWLAKRQVPRDPVPSRGSFTVRRLISGDERLAINREGHVPKTKLGVYAHAWLRGARTLVLTGSGGDAEKEISPLFPLNPARLAASIEWYGTVYAYVREAIGDGRIGALIGLLRESGGETREIAWPEPPALFDVAI